jgi:diguanylate cyclase (GGDEF)-like protein
MEERQGAETMAAIRELAGMDMIPLIVTGGGPDKNELRLRSFASGAYDFLEKPLNVRDLSVRIRRQLDISRQVKVVALLDKLTGAYNRSFLSIEMTRQLSDLQRSREPFTIAMIDLDRTRETNERFGYLEGSRWIARLGQFIRRRIRSSDVLARIGGDRFVLILPKTYAENAAVLIGRLQREFAQQAAAGDEGCSRTFSAGLLE